jgi:hypothetical protein
VAVALSHWALQSTSPWAVVLLAEFHALIAVLDLHISITMS